MSNDFGRIDSKYYDCFVGKSTELLVKLINEYEIAELKRRLNVFASFLYSVPRSQETPTGKPFTPIVPPAVEGFTFLGWYTDKNLQARLLTARLSREIPNCMVNGRRDALDKTVSKVRYFGATPPIKE